MHTTTLPAALPAEENERSLELLEKGYELAKKVEHLHGSRMAQSWQIYLAWEIWTKQFSWRKNQLHWIGKQETLPTSAFSMNELGFLYQTLGEWDKSEQYHKEALSLSQKAKDTSNS